MELELKHLAPYLPYGLKMINTKPGRQAYNIITKTTLKKIEIMDFENCYFLWFLNRKPILRPLSDLTKEIEINGEKFVPINQFYREERNLLEKELSVTNGNLICEFLSYKIMIKLFEWHFDVFGLIPTGLAIDINTIPKI
jgi:hypothetical protein